MKAGFGLPYRARGVTMVTRGFTGRGSGDQSDRIPPGQHLVEDFPVLSAGPTPRVEPLRLEIHSQNWSEARQNVELGRIQHSTKDPGDKGYSLRHLLVQTGYRLGGCTH